jgi:hypothetical protein
MDRIVDVFLGRSEQKGDRPSFLFATGVKGSSSPATSQNPRLRIRNDGEKSKGRPPPFRVVAAHHRPLCELLLLHIVDSFITFPP